MAQPSLGKIFLEGLFTLDGRIGRAGFWIGTAALLIAAVLFSVALTSGLRDLTDNAWPMWVLPVVFQLLIAWPTFALTVKRGHDRNRPAVFTLLLNIAGQFIPLALFYSGQREGAFWVWAVIGFYVLVDYGLLPGTPGPNRYGNPPVGK